VETPDPVLQHGPLVLHDVLHVEFVRHQLQGVPWRAQGALGDALKLTVQTIVIQTIISVATRKFIFINL
jgi:hypothetical protein